MSEGKVYFIKPVGMNGPIKVGLSSDHLARVEKLASWSPFPLEILAAVDGGKKLEARIHASISDLHTHHEWFRADPRLVSAIAAIQGGASADQAFGLAPDSKGVSLTYTRPIWTEEARARARENTRRWQAERKAKQAPSPVPQHHEQDAQV